MKPDKALVFIALAIRLRDTAHKLNDDEFKELLKEVSYYGVMSNRQLAKLTKNRMNHVAISRFMAKTNKTGGNVNGSDLEKIRAIIFSRSIRQIDYKLVNDVLQNGTSFNMLRRITGISWDTADKGRKLYGSIQQESQVR
jgi:hypothetical protein